MEFRDTIRQKLNTEIRWILRRISYCKCRPLYEI